MNCLVISQICCSTRVDELPHLLSKTDKNTVRKLKKKVLSNMNYIKIQYKNHQAAIKTDQDRISSCILTQTGQESGPMPHVSSTNFKAWEADTVCPASGLKYRGVIISRAHYDNTNHTISSSELEPDDLIHLTWFSVTHKHTVWI